MKSEITVHLGDSRDVLKTLADNSIDSVVTDPPYALVSIGKRFGADNAAPAKPGKSGAYARASAGFMGKRWDTGETAFAVEFWAEVMRVLKPGGHVVAFSGTRTYHRLACAVEDAGFEIRDMVAWLYGSGFPKSHDVSKGIDRAAGLLKPEGIAFTVAGVYNDTMQTTAPSRGYVRPEAQSDAARQWQGWGTALKPALEPVVLARKPLSGTVAQTVQEFGTGALNIDGARVAGDDAPEGRSRHGGGLMEGSSFQMPDSESSMPAGRWPANLIHDGAPETIANFPENASRFFYTAKADATERLGTKHPTVKPTDLMAYLIRLVTPPGGTTLDPFAGSGSTGVAAVFEGFNAVLIEREPEYHADILRRIAWAKGEGGLTMTQKRIPAMKHDPNDLFADEVPPHNGQTGPSDLRQILGRTIGPIGLKR